MGRHGGRGRFKGKPVMKDCMVVEPVALVTCSCRSRQCRQTLDRANRRFPHPPAPPPPQPCHAKWVASSIHD